MKKVSIIIPTFNRKKFIKTAIKSAIMQTYPNTEIIVVDDNSNYDISKEINEFKNKIILIKNKKNLGCAATLNIGIKASSGDYITILDDDDIFHPKKIERQMNIFYKNPNIGLVYCPIGIKRNNKIVYKPPKSEKNKWIRLAYQNDIGITPLIKRECFEKCGYFDVEFKYHEDRELWYRIGKKYKFAFNKEPSYIIYNLKINRMSSQINNIYSGKKLLYEKYKKDFENKNRYYSDFHYEIAYEYLNFGYLKEFFNHFKKSVKLNPYKLKEFFKIPGKMINYSSVKSNINLEKYQISPNI